jgi:predicted nucleic acid-binding protein
VIGPLMVVDASAAIKWIVEEADSDLARGLDRYELIAPEFLRVECLNALWRRIINGQLQAVGIPEMRRLLDALPIEFCAVEQRHEDILRLSVFLQHPVYDCAYLALALAYEVPVVTADRRFVSAVRRHGALANSIVLLGETAP